MSSSSITLTVEPALREALEAGARAENSSTAEVLHRTAPRRNMSSASVSSTRSWIGSQPRRTKG